MTECIIPGAHTEYGQLICSDACPLYDPYVTTGNCVWPGCMMQWESDDRVLGDVDPADEAALIDLAKPVPAHWVHKIAAREKERARLLAKYGTPLPVVDYYNQEPAPGPECPLYSGETVIIRGATKLEWTGKRIRGESS